MSRRFNRRSIKNTRTAYNYKPGTSLSEQERKIYRRLGLTLVLIVLISSAVYLWGVDMVVGLSSFWREFFPNSQVVSVGPDTEISADPLLAPRLDPLPQYTREQKVDVKGWSQAGMEVKIFLNGVEAATILVDKNGRFEFIGLEIKDGENEIFAKMYAQSKESDSSKVEHVTLDLTKPQIEVNYGDVSDTGLIPISGKTETGDSVFINEHRAIVQNDGTFSYELQLLAGANQIKIVAKDLAGNEETFDKSIDYSPVTVSPSPTGA